ncbi:hypothetical protein [Desulfotignum balticum]|uniref:hypothetical protein n=1 Tax=Desulfotignum balticum TaxID=115781 RepID=UPI000410A2D2|nr:hypothetical protein [Desulfotignum balticum]
MGFDAEKFLNTKMQPRTADVPVPGLASWFGEGEPVFKVRGITGQELGQAKQAVATRKDLAALVDGIIGGTSKEKAESAKKILGMGEAVPEQVALRIHIVRLGSVDPDLDEEATVKLCTCYPVEFEVIGKKILELTGQGHEPGKAEASGVTPASEAR